MQDFIIHGTGINIALSENGLITNNEFYNNMGTAILALPHEDALSTHLIVNNNKFYFVSVGVSLNRDFSTPDKLLTTTQVNNNNFTGIGSAITGYTNNISVTFNKVSLSLLNVLAFSVA